MISIYHGQLLGELECGYPMAYPWNETRREDMPRYVKAADGWWYDPNGTASGKALLSCTGDLICEPRLIRAHRYGDQVLFHPLFQYVRPFLRQADFVIGNLETTVSDMTPDAGLYHTVAGTYHCNTTESFLDALRYAGFDGVVNANNHDCDSGALGLIQTNQRLDHHGFARTGTFLPGETDRAMLVNINGIRVGVLSYASHFNRNEGNFTEEGMKMLNPFCPERVAADVAWAKARGAEFILCYIHWGKEYQHYPTDVQKEQAQVLADAGVDYIVGSHSHCLQINDQIAAQDGRKVPVMYSLGNFITNESKDLCRHSGILQLLLEKRAGGIQVSQWFIPCYIYDAFETLRYGPVPADTFMTGGVDHPERERTCAFAKNLITLPQPMNRVITAADLCALFQIPQIEQTFCISGVCTEPSKIRDRQVYFSLGNETKLEQLSLFRRRPILVVAEEPNPTHLTLVVPDVKQAYRQLTAYLCSTFTGKILTVVGGENKTVTAALITQTLKQKFRVCDEDWKWHPSQQWWVREQAESAFGYSAVESDICVVTSPVTSLPPMKKDGIVFYNSADAALIQQFEKDPNAKSFEAVPFSGLRMEQPAGAAAAVAQYLQIAPLQEYRYSGMELNVFTIDGMQILTDYACKSVDSAMASLAVLSRHGGKKIAVVEARFAPYAKADVVIALPQPSAERPERVKAELQLEKEILAQLEPGCAVLLCGGRHLALNLTLRRLFGLTDGDIYDLT